MKNKSKIFIAFLIILINLLIFFTAKFNENISGNIIKNISKDSLNQIKKFQIIKPTSEDFINGRFAIKNRSINTISNIQIKIDNAPKNIISQKTIEPGNQDYIYIKEIIP